MSKTIKSVDVQVLETPKLSFSMIKGLNEKISKDLEAKAMSRVDVPVFWWNWEF